MLSHLALGDAYGAGFEFVDAELIARRNDLSAYLPHPLGQEAGRYTDDTQMSIAISEWLLADGPWDLPAVARHCVAAYRRDPRAGYAKGLQSLLDQVGDGDELLARIRPNSARNGAAMRAAPLGVIADPAALQTLAALQARLTHATEAGERSAQAIALMAHYFIYDLGPIQDLPKFLQKNDHGDWRQDWSQTVACDALETVHAVLTLLLRHRSLSALLRASVDLGGDVDTVAALTLAIASGSREYADDLPTALWRDLENGPWGLDYLGRLDERLLARRGWTPY